MSKKAFCVLTCVFCHKSFGLFKKMQHDKVEVIFIERVGV